VRDTAPVGTPEPLAFAERWIELWNGRDLEGVLTHYADDVVFTSPTALRFAADSGGTIRGKAALRDYWTRALGANPALRFSLIDVYAGIDMLVVHYRNQLGAPISEVMVFRDGRVVTGHAAHLV
jgi:ketosteroid isomerase-like protein